MPFFDIKKAFVLTAVVIIALVGIEQFFILFFCVTVHEAAHVLTAARYGLKTSRVIITALGETSVIEGIEGLSLKGKLAVVAAGPVSNIFIGLICVFIGDRATQLAAVNFSIAAFNLLPAYPMDGGRLLRYALGEAAGVINAHKFAVKAARIVYRLLIIIGYVQVVLYPFNISLICIGLYLANINKNRYVLGIYEFYKAKLANIPGAVSVKPSSGEGYRTLKAVRLVVGKELPLSILSDRLCHHRFFIYEVVANGGVSFEFNELQLIEFIFANGLNKTVDDLCGDKLFGDTLCK